MLVKILAITIASLSYMLAFLCIYRARIEKVSLIFESDIVVFLLPAAVVFFAYFVILAFPHYHNLLSARSFLNVVVAALLAIVSAIIALGISVNLFGS